MDTVRGERCGSLAISLFVSPRAARLAILACAIRDFLAAGLVDHGHLVVVPILLGRGVRLWDGLEGIEQKYRVETTASPSGVTHLTFTRASV